jgi:hypothetical protein
MARSHGSQKNKIPGLTYIYITTAVLKKLNTHGSLKNSEKVLTTQKIASFFCQFFAGSFLKPSGSLRVHEFELNSNS